MSYSVRILTLAESDAVQAALWYDAQLPGLGLEFLEEVRAAAERLRINPEIHRVRFADVRRMQVERFKYYGLYYLLRDAEVWIIAVHHGRRHPHWLQNRRNKIG